MAIKYEQPSTTMAFEAVEYSQTFDVKEYCATTSRTTTKDWIICGYRFPAGSVICAGLSATHEAQWRISYRLIADPCNTNDHLERDPRVDDLIGRLKRYVKDLPGSYPEYAVLDE